MDKMEITKTKVNIPSRKINPAIMMAPQKSKSRLWEMLDYVMPDYKRYYLYNRETDTLHGKLYNRTDLVFEVAHAIEENVEFERIFCMDVIPVDFYEDKLLQEFEPIFTEAFSLKDVYEVIIQHHETGGTTGEMP